LQVPQPLVDLLDINLVGCLYFTRIALAYLQQNRSPQDAVSKSITLVSSCAGFKESPGLVAYSASKHGIIGLVRALRLLTVPQFNVRINAICPWATDTAMIAGAVNLFHQNKIPLNTAEDVARIIQQVGAGPEYHGKAIYCSGGIGVDIEEGINTTEPLWLGEKHAADLNRGQNILGGVSLCGIS
jgi:NAD(P)-dependent dehydrogenase (short-subunit alcohol dehydrogenase family)